jgi:hypothetical protein
MMQEEGGDDPKVGGGQGWKGATTLGGGRQKDEGVQQPLGLGLVEEKKLGSDTMLEEE